MTKKDFEHLKTLATKCHEGDSHWPIRTTVFRDPSWRHCGPFSQRSTTSNGSGIARGKRLEKWVKER